MQERRRGERGEEGGERRGRKTSEFTRRGEERGRLESHLGKHAEVCPADETVVSIQNETLQEVLQIFHDISCTNCAS